MADAAIGAAVELLMQNLLSMLSEEIKLVQGFEEDLTKLQNSLTTIQKFLSDAEKKEINDEAVKEWLNQLQDVAFEADAVVDELNYQFLRQKVKNQKRETEKVSCSFSSGSDNLLFRRKIARKINDVNKKLEFIDKAAVSKGLQIGITTARHAIGLVETDSFRIDSNIVGRDDDVAKIVEMLVTAPVDETFSVIPIVGMGGLGKTTLARKVFHDETIATHFEVKIWVCVSINFGEVTLFQMILKTLTGEDAQGIVIKEVVLEKIHKVLAGKRCLLVLDDLWNKDFRKWEDFTKSLSGVSSVKRNVIVVTTREEDVASAVETLPTCRLRTLSEDDCWSIIKEKALSRVDDPLEFEEIGKCIAKKCCGLPLAADLLGGLLRGKPKDEWSSILKDQLSNFGDGENHVRKILKLSYDRLPSSSLKRCFAYCSIFPQDYPIEKENLIKLWMAEGFLQANQENDLEFVGSIYFNHLLQASLIQDPRRDYYGNITHCKMHDLVHDLACSVSASGSRSVDVRLRGNFMNKVRYRYVAGNEPNAVSEEQARYLRTLILNAKVTDDIFSSFRCLHSLTLVDSSIRELPIEIGKQIHLRFLDISQTSIKILPNSLSKLSNLQTLAVPTYSKLPNTIVDLFNLRHLHVVLTELPPWLGKLTSLQTLPYYKVDSKKGLGIGELGKLKYLKGVLEIQNLGMVHDKEDAKHASLFEKTSIFKLGLEWEESKERETNDENVLEGLQPYSSLKSLKIDGYRSINFPSWTMKMTVYDDIGRRWLGLNNLIEIKLLHCHQCEEIPSLGHLPRLKFLEIKDFQNVQSIGLSFYGLEYYSTSSMIENVNIQKSRITFPALQKLSLSELPSLLEWVDAERRVAAFPCLDNLKITSCPELKSVPTHFPCLKRLEIYQIDAEICLKNICTNTSSLQRLQITCDSGIICLPDGLLVKNQDLSYLQIVNCPNLMSLVQDLIGGASSLRELRLWDCSSLRKLPEDLHTLHSLQILEIFNCQVLKSVPYQRDQCQDLASLRQLQIRNCRGLIDFPYALLESSTSSLEIMKLYNLENLDFVIPCKSVNFPMKISSFQRLRHFSVGRFSKSLDVVSFNDFLKCILHENHSLVDVQLYGNEDWDSLPDQIQHFTALQTLGLSDFGIESLPDWLGNLCSLENLWITNCKRLKHMPSKEATQRLTKLYIKNCPLMAERCTQEQNTHGVDDSEWPKISHILEVRIDLKRLSTGNSHVQVKKKSPACWFPIPRIGCNKFHSPDYDTDSNLK